MVARLTLLGLLLLAAQVHAQSASRTTAPPHESTQLKPIDRVWTDASGKRKSRAILLSIEGSTGRFKRADGQVAEMPLGKLSAADQQFIANLQTPELKPSFNEFGKSMAGFITAWPTKGLDAGKSVLDQIDDLQSESVVPPPGNAVYFRVSEAFLQRRMAREINRETQVNEEILGTHNRGIAHTIGNPIINLLPSKKNGLAELHLTGHVHSKTVGYNGPVQIHSHSDTGFRAIAKLTLTPDKLTAGPASTRANTRSTIDDITSSLPRLRGRIATNIAWRRASEQLAQAEEIAAQRAAARITREFNDGASERLKKLSEFARKQLENSDLTAASDERPPTVECTTTDEYLQIVVISPDAAPWVEEPARLADKPDIEVHLHRRAMSAAMSEVGILGVSMTEGSPVLRYWLSRWAVNVILPRVTEVLSGPNNEAPRIDARWSDDDQWLTLVWRQPEDEKAIAERIEKRRAARTARRATASSTQ